MEKGEIWEESPVIAAVKDEEGLKKCLETECEVIFILYGNICNIQKIVQAIKNADKTAIVHVDLITGFSSKEIVVDYIKENTSADGIISTRMQMVKRAMELGLIGVQRTFIIDSMAITNMKKQIDSFQPDAIEVMPGIMPKIIKRIRSYTKIPIIAGGLLSDKRDVLDAFDSGADAISTTREELWYI